ncbi:MAG: hypothetical protein KDA69_04545 [Planctomycetaceae bacterium]|nr:hypothetical protein [Planctomycetaceae bacterium]MCA9043565.1 hypothetical protein [Planctomycetaceae bacterium]
MSIVPAPFLFRATLSVPRIDALPRATEPLLELPESCRVPFPSSLSGNAPFSELRMAWNRDGLAVSVRVQGTMGMPAAHPDTPETSDGVRVWIDTRNTQNIHRASRYCHLFHILPVGNGDSGLEPCVRQIPVPRAGEDAPEANPDAFLQTSSVSKTEWQVDTWFPAETLYGFDPERLGRLSFYCHVRDKHLGHDFFSVGEDFPFAADPSLWSTLELVSAD